jgi:mono/diheme cytochrome c family protein
MLPVSTRRFLCAISAALAVAAIALRSEPARAQDQDASRVSVADGVYSDAQAARGGTVFRNHCAHCHAADLTGMEGPALSGDGFMRQWGGRSLERLFRKIKDSMPPAGAASLNDAEKLDALAFILQQNGFPAGTNELIASSPVLHNERPIGGDDRPRVGTLVQVSGCLTRTANQVWSLFKASTPVSTSLETSGPFDAAVTLSGELVIRLLNVFPSPEPHAGSIVTVRGLLVEDASSIVINVVSLERAGSAC